MSTYFFQSHLLFRFNWPNGGLQHRSYSSLGIKTQQNLQQNFHQESKVLHEKSLSGNNLGATRVQAYKLRATHWLTAIMAMLTFPTWGFAAV